MRKTIILLALIVLTLFAFTVPALAAPTHKAVFVVGQASYTVDDQAKQMDAKTFIENSRTYVPVRYLGDALGAETGWDEGTRTVTVALDNAVVKLVIGSKTLSIDGQAKQMDVAPVIRDGRTYLPARFVAEAFGYTVRWNSQARTVYVGPPVEIGTYPFPAKLIKLEMEVGSKKAVGTRPDGSKVEITLPEAPYLVVKNEWFKNYLLKQGPNPEGEYFQGTDIYKTYPPLVDSSQDGSAMYVPFVAVADAFGVPEQNMVWDGGKLRVWYDKDEYVSLTPDSKTVEFKNIKDNWSRNAGDLEAPIKIKNGVVMIGETSGDGIRGFLFSVAEETLIEAFQRDALGDTGDLSGKPSICCSVALRDHEGYYVKYWDYKSRTIFEERGLDAFLRQKELQKRLGVSN